MAKKRKKPAIGNKLLYMSVDKIRLPDFLIADFYKDSLVELDSFFSEPQPATVQKPQVENEENLQTIKYVGENQKRVTILVNLADSENLNKPDLTFLTNILKACQLSLSDIAIVNIGSGQILFTELKEQLSPLQLLLFDVEPAAIKLPFTIPAFQVQNYDGCTILLSPALSLLNQATTEGRLLKTKLWNSLKQVFNIN